jgi:hypothetical protein
MAIYLHVFFKPLIDSSEVDFHKIFQFAGVENQNPVAVAVTDRQNPKVCASIRSINGRATQ